MLRLRKPSAWNVPLGGLALLSGSNPSSSSASDADEVEPALGVETLLFLPSRGPFGDSSRNAGLFASGWIVASSPKPRSRLPRRLEHAVGSLKACRLQVVEKLSREIEEGVDIVLRNLRRECKCEARSPFQPEITPNPPCVLCVFACLLDLQDQVPITGRELSGCSAPASASFRITSTAGFLGPPNSMHQSSKLEI